MFAPDGKLIGRILLPERCANVCFGGVKRNRLFMAASQSVYRAVCGGAGRAGRVAGRRCRLGASDEKLFPPWRRAATTMTVIPDHDRS